MAADQKKIPQTENPFHFASKRFEEMTQLLNTLKAPKQTKLVFQTLPKHMRRRAATQNPKRLPRRVRSTHISQFKKSGTPLKGKRPTRKYRRKPCNLRVEYAKRDSRTKWLETHIWHAKRFHMITRWGYKLPWSPCDKSYRACYRATSKYCLMQDMTYFNTIELSGPIEILKENFRKISSSQCGLTLNAMCYRNGKREGETYLFKTDQYPLGCLAKVTFFWLPEAPGSGQSTVWMSLHPAALNLVKQELVQLFQLSNENNGESFARENIRMRILDRNFNRFRLSGPLSHAVVTKALKGLTMQNRNDLPFHEYLSRQDLANQQCFWSTMQKCENTSQLPSNMILSVVVEDPRLNRPDHRSYESPRLSSSHISELPDRLTESALFHPEILASIEANVLSQKMYSKSRHESSVVPGQRCKFEGEMQAVPIILIQRPGDQGGSGRLGFNGGWDVIVPKGYGSIFWLSFVMWGARAGGLRELMSNNRESKQQWLIPDTLDGLEEAALAFKVSRDTFFRKPCNKRPNYVKLAVASPFLSPWKQLLGEWGGTAANLYVLRDKSVLQALQEHLKGHTLDPTLDLESLKSALVPISFKMIGRGSPSPNSIICLPTAADRGQFSPKNGSSHPVYTEPLRADPFESTRKNCRRAHLRLLAKLRRKRLKSKRAQQLTSSKKVLISKPLTEQIILDQHRKMCELWLPSKWGSIRNQCSRETIGYCTSADYSFTEGHSSGTGYLAFQGFLQFVKAEVSSSHSGFVLIRNTNSRNYRVGELTISLNL